MLPQANAQWERIKEVFSKICDLDPAEQMARLDEACAGDPEIRVSVEELLAEYETSREFFAGFPKLFSSGSATRPQVRAFQDGEIVADRFRIVRLIGEGGMGEVYEAEDRVLHHEHVALKTLHATLAADPGSIERLIGELRKARSITHPNVCRVHDVVEHRSAAGERILFFTMELLNGGTLADRLHKGRMRTGEALPLVKQMAAAIDAAHAAGIAHGDFKPANIVLIASREASPRVVVTDFGLSRWLPTGSTLLTATVENAGWGTPAYLAPERLVGGKVTRATDIYSLGVVMYEMVTGQRPFADESPLFLALKQLRRRLRLPRELVSDLDGRWEGAILRCLDANPGERFASAGDVVDELERAPARPKWRMGVAAAVVCVAVLAVPAAREKAVQAFAGISRSVAEYFEPQRAVSVLPFSRETRTPARDAFSLGLTAAVTDRLTTWSRSHQRLYVVPAAETVNAGVDTPALARLTLGVNAIVKGRMLEDGNRRRVIIQLHEISDRGDSSKDSFVVEVVAGDQELLHTQVAVAIARLLGLRAPTANQQKSDLPPEAETSYLLGRGYLLLGPEGLPAAIAAFQHVTEIDSRISGGHVGLSEAYLARYEATRDPGSIKNAALEIEEAVKFDPTDLRARVLRGRLYSVTGQHQRAIDELQQALTLDPKAPGVRNELAKVYEAAGRAELAEKEYRTAIEKQPRYCLNYGDYGRFLFSQGRIEEAEQSLLTGSACAPANKNAIARLAVLYADEEKFAAAETELERGLKVAPDAILYNNLGWIYILEGNFERAVTVLKEAVKQPRANSIVWSSLARASRWSGQRDQAMRAAYATSLERADEELRVNPSNLDVRSNRAYLLTETGHSAEGIREIDEMLEIGRARGNVTILFRSALIHELAGDRHKALAALEAAARAGYPKRRAERDPDLRDLRNDPDYQRLSAAWLTPNLRVDQSVDQRR